MDYGFLFLKTIPELILASTIFIALGVDYGLMRRSVLSDRSRIAAGITALGLILAIAVLQFQIKTGVSVDLLDQQLVLNPLTQFFKCFIYGLTLVIVFLASKRAYHEHVSEFYALILLSALGMVFLITTKNLLLLFIALELMSLCLYALTGFSKKRAESIEAALKYFSFGAISSAFLLFGLSYLYGVTNTLDLTMMPARLEFMEPGSPLFLVAIVFIFVGLGFKIAVVPFHLWAPDAYEGSPTPVAALIATGSKVASFFVLAQVLSVADAGQTSARMTWVAGLAVLAALSVLLGNLGALRQTNIKRLLAYSSIAHAGYLVIGLLPGSKDGVSSLYFYLVVYSLANLGAFGVISILGDKLGKEIDFSDMGGCWQRAPFLSILLFIFILSLAGIPPLSGFVGKYYLFFAAIASQPTPVHWYDGWYWLVGFALIMSTISLFYYLKILKEVFITEVPQLPRIFVGKREQCALAILAGLVLWFGLFPNCLMKFLSASISF